MQMASRHNGYFTNMLFDETFGQSQVEEENKYCNNEKLGQSQIIEENDNINIKRRRQQNFSNDEDFQLISGYLNVSIDSVIGNQQKQYAFWKRVNAYFFG